MSLLQQSWVQDSAHWEPFSQNTYCESPVHLAAQESQELTTGSLEFCLTTKPICLTRLLLVPQFRTQQSASTDQNSPVSH